MASPTPYALAYDFTAWQAANPTSPLPADKIEIEYNAIATTTGELITNIDLLQRSDGALFNGIVTYDALSNTVKTLLGNTQITVKGAWVTSTAYVVDDLVDESGASYICAVAHTSGTFSTDLAANKWLLWAGAGDASAMSFTPAGTIAATDVQAAIEEVSGDVTGITANAQTFAGANTHSGINTFSAANSFSATTTMTGSLITSGKVAFKDDGDLTISTGAVTITGASHVLLAESGTADTLSTITGGADGEIVVFRPDAGDTITVDEAGNIVTPNGLDIVLVDTKHTLVVQYDLALTKWLVLSSISENGYPNNGYLTGRYYFGLGWAPSTSDFTGTTADHMYAKIFTVAETETFTRIGAEVATAIASSNARMGIYNVEDGVPTTLLLDAGTFATTTTGEKEITISQKLAAGVYALALIGDETTVDWKRSTGSLEITNHFVGGQSGQAANQSTWIDSSGSYGALPSTFTVSSYTSATAVPTMWLRKV